MTTMETGSHWQAEEVDRAWIDAAAAAATAADDHPHVIVSRIKEGTRKRLYEHGEGELDREMDKMYKRDYWEDPAYAPLLELSGLFLARAEAIDCFSDCVLRATDAMLALFLARAEAIDCFSDCVLRATDAMLAQRCQEWEERRSRAAHESEPARAAAAGDEGRLFLCFWRLIVNNLAALLRYFIG